MKERRERKENLSDVAIKSLLCSFVSMIMTITIMDTLIFPLNPIAIFFASLLCVLILLLISYNNIFRIIFYVIIFIIGAIVVATESYNKGAHRVSMFADMAYTKMPSFLILMGVSIFYYVFIVLFPSFYMCFLLTAAVIVGMLVVGYEVSVTTVIIFISIMYAIYILQRYTSVFNRVSYQNKLMITTPPKMTVKMTMSYVLIFVILITANIGSNPILGDNAEKILEKIETLFSNSWIDKPSNSDLPESNMFTLSSMGFGSGGELGGNVTMDKHHMLTVYSNKSGIYLGGATYDEYTGRKWSSNASSRHNSLSEGWYYNDLVIYEKVAGINALYYDTETQEKNISNITAVVIHERALRTETIFSLSKSQTILFNYKQANHPLYFSNTKWQDSVNSLISDKHEKYRVKENIPFKGAYVTQGDVLNPKAKYYNEIMLRSYKGFYTFSKQQIDPSFVPSFDIQKVSKELADRSAYFEKIYTQLPKNLPERVKNLAETITRGLTGNYQKAKAIEKYLSENYTYTLTPGEVPKGKDFVDYFLFESKQGYCTYYATAMTVLLRCVDVPARYTEGFIVTSDCYRGNSRYEITGENAHAWPEVYLEGIGLVEFEPTSSYTGTVIEEQTDATATPRPSLTPRYTPTPDVSTTPGITPKITPEVTPAPSASPKATDKKGSVKFDVLTTIITVIASLAVIFVSLICINAIKLRLFRRKALKAPYALSVIYVFKRLEKLFAIYYTPRQPVFTLPEYENILYGNKAFTDIELKDIYDKAAGMFNKARYSSGKVNEKDALNMLVTYEEFVSLQKRLRGGFKYFINRYIYGKM